MVEQVLLLARIAFVVLLYLFVWRVVRLSVRDVRAPQESMVLSAAAARAAGLGSALPRQREAPALRPRLLVLASGLYPEGTSVVLDEDVTFGRAPDCDVVLDGDGTVSAHHARVFHRDGSIYVEDLGSTNGTCANGQQLAAERLLRDGDLIVIGSTTLRAEGLG